jgi:hypothetical protein
MTVAKLKGAPRLLDDAATLAAQHAHHFLV